MLEEKKAERDSQAIEFKNTMFGHAFMSQNPELYKKVYPEEFGMTLEEEMEQLEWAVPSSEAEALALFDEVFSELAEPDELDEWRSLPLLAESQ